MSSSERSDGSFSRQSRTVSRTVRLCQSNVQKINKLISFQQRSSLMIASPTRWGTYFLGKVVFRWCLRRIDKKKPRDCIWENTKVRPTRRKTSKPSKTWCISPSRKPNLLFSSRRKENGVCVRVRRTLWKGREHLDKKLDPQVNNTR